MDRVVQVHNALNLIPEILFLTVNYIDRFLSTKHVSIKKLLLVGVTALFLTAKYEGRSYPATKDIMQIAGISYSINDLKKAKRFMLQQLNYNLGYPGPISFL